ncbi:hypothetical protein EVAR_101199_1 [Eumeta japonica]|uniref:Uncharacterized protein n=1 Tax=Eumeta variegata TaxID=151549 RepID=A0A4C2AC57_EUMVA|nr:hypothetical protein EVAR_101199_1 [Eumeta japonica]
MKKCNARLRYDERGPSAGLSPITMIGLPRTALELVHIANVLQVIGLMMEPQGKHRNSIMKQRILAVFGLVEIVLRCTLTMNDFQGLIMQLEGRADEGLLSSDPAHRFRLSCRPAERDAEPGDPGAVVFPEGVQDSQRIRGEKDSAVGSIAAARLVAGRKKARQVRVELAHRGSTNLQRVGTRLRMTEPSRLNIGMAGLRPATSSAWTVGPSRFRPPTERPMNLYCDV